MDGREGADSPRAHDGGRLLHPTHPDRRDDQRAVEEDRHRGGRQGVERNLFFTLVNNNEQQIAIWLNDGSEVLYLFPRHALPVDPVEALLGNVIARWYASDGQQGKEPKDPQLREALELFRSAAGKKPQERYKIAQEIWKIMVDEQFGIGTVGQSPAAMGVRVVSKRLGNIPARQVNAQHARTPCSSHQATFYFKALPARKRMTCRP